MKRETIYKYYWFGTCLRYLQDAKAGHEIHGSGYIIHNLDEFFWFLEELGLLVTMRVAVGLKKMAVELREQEPNSVLSAEQATELAEKMRDIRKTLESELEGFEAYIVSPKRVDVKKLLDDVGGLFAPGVYISLPEIAQYDLSEAGKCIAFERPTAAAFHLMRGTEAILREFYCTLVKQKRCALMLDPMIAGLRANKKGQKHEILLNHLDNIRRSFRNPTQHPEMIYDIHEVQDLLGVCIDVINRMAQIFK